MSIHRRSQGKTKDKKSNIETVRHSLAHIMAAAVKELYPKVKFGIGPAIENGFYYDFDFGKIKMSDEDLPKIEKEMRELLKKGIRFQKSSVSKIQAKKLFKSQPYKLELIKDLPGKTASLYQSGGFVDLCKGPHIKSTKEINPAAFKLTKVAGAYWRGDEKNPMLTRIYGIAFETEKELKDYLKQQEEAEKRDHRKLGAKLDLFSFHEEASGMVFWHPKGMLIREKLIEFWREEHQKAGYQEISTPLILKEDLWHTSRHMETYKENMYFSKIDEKLNVIKPMNCPGGLLLYKEKNHSYKELPLRVAELGLVHRQEMAGVLHGLFRVRAFTQDDAHIYCNRTQVEEELKGVLKLTLKIYKTFGFKDFHLELSTRPKKYTGTLKMWGLAEGILERVLKEVRLPYKINPGDGAFYGPKIDSHLKDSIGRTWQCGTLQLDFAQPENFELEYIDEKGKKQRPVMLHRTIYGSLERFIGILIEHYAGALPVWLAPCQVWVIPVGSSHRKYTQEITQTLVNKDIRAKDKTEAETVGKKIREGEMQKIPYLLVAGDKEIKAKMVSVRHRNKDLGVMSVDKFLQKITIEIENK